MKKPLFTSLLVIAFSYVLQAQADFEVFYQSPFGIGVSYNPANNDFKLEFAPSINTPFGSFGISASGSLTKEDEQTVRIIEKEVPTPVYIEVPVFKERIVEKPVIKIRTVEKIKIVETGVYVIELRNYKAGKSQEFIIKGLDVFRIETSGDTKIEAKEGRFVIDVLKSEVTYLEFKGGQLSSENKDDLILKACLELNQELGYNRYPMGFTLNPLEYNPTPNDTSTEQSKLINDSRNRANDLIARYQVSNFNDKPIAFASRVLITQEGIGLAVNEETNGLFKRFSKERDFLFFQWKEFAALGFKMEEDGTLLIQTPYQQTYRLDSRAFSSTHYLRIFKKFIEVVSQ